MTGWEPRSEFLRELNAEARAAALVEGEAIGEVRGVAIGACRTLRTVLHLRFGALTPEQEERLQAASLDTLDRWTSRALTAPSIDAALQDLPEAQ